MFFSRALDDTNEFKSLLQHIQHMFLRSAKREIVHLLHQETPPQRVTFMEELGRGAYGKVHKGVMMKIASVEVFFKPKEERLDISEGIVVAIKTPLGNYCSHNLFHLELNNSVRYPRGFNSSKYRDLHMIASDKSPCFRKGCRYPNDGFTCF